MSLVMFGPTKKADIRIIQRLINLRGLKIPVDGKWGDLAQQSVKKLLSDQKPNFNKTKNSSMPQFSSLLVELDSASANEYPEVTKWIQKRLNQMGYRVGNSGFFDANTQSAIKQLQKQMDIQPTGSITPYIGSTWNALLEGSPLKVQQIKRGSIDPNYLASKAKQIFVREISEDENINGYRNNKVDVWVNNSTASVPSESDPGPVIRLSKGSSGDDVRELQQMINDAGYGLIAVDGVWGADTEGAVSKYLEYYNSPKFQEALEPIDNVPPTKLRMDSQGEYVGQLQRMLNDAGYGTIVVDKIWGRNTESSVSKYLHDYNSINI